VKKSGLILLIAFSIFAIQGCSGKKAKMTKRGDAAPDVTQTNAVGGGGSGAQTTQKRSENESAATNADSAKVESNDKSSSVAVVGIPQANNKKEDAKPSVSGPSATVSDIKPTSANTTSSVESNDTKTHNVTTVTTTSQVAEGVVETRVVTTKVPKADSGTYSVTETVRTEGKGQSETGGVRGTVETTYEKRTEQVTSEKKEKVDTQSSIKIVFRDETDLFLNNTPFLLSEFVLEDDFYSDSNIVAEVDSKGVVVIGDDQRVHLSDADMKAIIDSQACRHELTRACVVIDDNNAYALTVRLNDSKVQQVYIGEFSKEALQEQSFGGEDFSAVVQKPKSDRIIESHKEAAKEINGNDPVVFSRAYSKEVLVRKTKTVNAPAPVEERK